MYSFAYLFMGLFCSLKLTFAKRSGDRDPGLFFGVNLIVFRHLFARSLSLISLFTYLFTYLLMSFLFRCLSALCLFVCLLIHLPTYLLVYSFVYLFTYSYISLLFFKANICEKKRGQRPRGYT